MTGLGDGPGLVVRLGTEGVGLVLRREAPPMRAAPLRPADRLLAEPPNDLLLPRREAPPNDLPLLRREAPPNDLPPLLREDPPPRERPPLEPPDLLLMGTSLVVCTAVPRRLPTIATGQSIQIRGKALRAAFDR
ncbi:MAG TPA: hypothetical protein H9836_01240 [Candidatus Nocardiopsis merdipullorum]|nr:hypothetical protein [Candidatus Nocardiopsis merdipullorum]